jgi:hypothetical protein
MSAEPASVPDPGRSTSARSDAAEAESLDPARPPEHQLPPDFVFLICAALAGGLPAGIFTTLISEPGRSGSPIYGLLLPWGILPFFLVLVAGWRGRHAAGVRRLAWFTSAAALLGMLAHGYAFLFLPGFHDARKWFLFVPLWQWGLIARPALRCAFPPVPTP